MCRPPPPNYYLRTTHGAPPPPAPPPPPPRYYLEPQIGKQYYLRAQIGENWYLFTIGGAQVPPDSLSLPIWIQGPAPDCAPATIRTRFPGPKTPKMAELTQRPQAGQCPCLSAFAAAPRPPVSGHCAGWFRLFPCHNEVLLASARLWRLKRNSLAACVLERAGGAGGPPQGPEVRLWRAPCARFSGHPPGTANFHRSVLDFALPACVGSDLLGTHSAQQAMRV